MFYQLNRDEYVLKPSLIKNLKITEKTQHFRRTFVNFEIIQWIKYKKNLLNVVVKKYAWFKIINSRNWEAF